MRWLYFIFALVAFGLSSEAFAVTKSPMRIESASFEAVQSGVSARAENDVAVRKLKRVLASANDTAEIGQRYMRLWKKLNGSLMGK
jgi:hypothetical protein